MKRVIIRGKSSKRLNKVKPVKNINKNLHAEFSRDKCERKSFLHINKQDHASIKIFLNQRKNPSQRNCQNQLIHLSLSHIEQEYRESLIQGKICIQLN